MDWLWPVRLLASLLKARDPPGRGSLKPNPRIICSQLAIRSQEPSKGRALCLWGQWQSGLQLPSRLQTPPCSLPGPLRGSAPSYIARRKQRPAPGAGLLGASPWLPPAHSRPSGERGGCGSAGSGQGARAPLLGWLCSGSILH